ncbi:MAG: L-rhamnose/proton symporter RhaT [Bryobacteraceae bacterium]
MSANVLYAIALVLGASIINAVYVLPMRANRKWAWENSWFAFSILGEAVVPTLMAIFTVPGLWTVYAATPGVTLMKMALFGLLWGINMVLFGLAIPIVGLAITFAVSLGTSAACGSLLPLLMADPGRLFTSLGALIVLGLAVIIAGVALCGVAGRLRERLEGKDQPQRSSRFYKGFIYTLCSGVLGSMLNLGLASGKEIQRLAFQQGASEAAMSNAVWLPCLYAGFLPGVVYCLYLMKKNGTTGTLIHASRWYYWCMAALMGIFWYGSVMIYSLATVKLGEFGPVIGWPLFMSCVVIVSMINGLITGEWSRTGARPIRIMTAGIFCLVLAIAILSYATR